MHLKNLSKRALSMAALTGLVASSILLYYFIPRSSNQTDQVVLATNTATSNKQEEVKNKIVNPGFPLRLRIPTINVNATFEYVGLTLNGELIAPKNPANAGWYVRGPRPGEKGSAVIDGHSGYKDNIPAIFDSLHSLQAGDSVYVEDDKGVTTVFVVHTSQSYDPKTDASSVFSSTDGKAHLNLITCEGAWNEILQSYSSRLVVFADKQ